MLIDRNFFEYYILPIIKFVAAFTFVTTHPVLSRSVLRSNFKSLVQKNKFVLFFIIFSFTYIYTDNLESSLILAIVFITMK